MTRCSSPIYYTQGLPFEARSSRARDGRGLEGCLRRFACNAGWNHFANTIVLHASNTSSSEGAPVPLARVTLQESCILSLLFTELM